MPHCDSPQTAREAVAAVRYPPLGDRGMAAGSRAADYGKIPLADHMAQSNREISLTVMIEDLAAVDQIEAIAATPGIDLVAVGPSDMSRALGLSGQPDHPKLAETIERVRRAVEKGGVAKLALPLEHPAFPRSAAQLRDMGVGYANCSPGPEQRLLKSFSEQVAAARRQLGG